LGLAVSARSFELGGARSAQNHDLHLRARTPEKLNKNGGKGNW
jgi:hypothetical protein